MKLLGKLDWAAIPFDQPIIMGATAGMGLLVAFVLGWVTWKRACEPAVRGNISSRKSASSRSP